MAMPMIVGTLVSLNGGASAESTNSLTNLISYNLRIGGLLTQDPGGDGLGVSG